jgi:uncharacterized Zn finger protein
VASVVDLVEPGVLTRLATPANSMLGREIADQGGVEVAQFGPLRVRAKVGGVAAAVQRRRVELVSGSNGLEWSCTCSSRKDLFCKHCVATALVVWERTPLDAHRAQPRPI